MIVYTKDIVKLPSVCGGVLGFFFFKGKLLDARELFYC